MGGLYGDRSYRKLIRDAYGANKGNIIIDLKYQEFSETIGSEKITILQPLSIVYSGHYSYTYGSIPYSRNIEAYIIETSQESQKLNTNLVIMKIVLALGYGTYKNADGNSVRCVAKSFINTPQPII